MNSMTGYGKSAAEIDGRKLTVEMRSVNHRFLDVSIKLPKYLNYLEDAVRKGVADNFQRGHFDIYINYENKRDDGVKLTLNEGVADEYLRMKKEIVDKYDVTDDFSVTAMLKTSDLVTVAAADDDEDAIAALLQAALPEAVEQMRKMRAYEGEKLRADINKKIENIEATVVEIKKLAPKTVENYRQKLRERITEALNGVEIDETRLINEVAFFSDKVSIDEEITRLTTHCQHLRKLTEIKTPVGKNMDFLVQEFNREANTIGSKCNDIGVTNFVLTLKNEIEKIREQVQNVE